jgi:hypothetical protein
MSKKKKSETPVAAATTCACGACRKLEDARSALKVIHTWASFQDGRALNCKDVIRLTRRVLDDTEPNAEGMARELNHSKTKLSPELQALLDSTRPLADLDLKGLKRSIRKAAQDSESPTNQNKQ